MRAAESFTKNAIFRKLKWTKVATNKPKDTIVTIERTDFEHNT